MDIEGSTGGWEQELPAVRSRSRIGHSAGRGSGGSHRQGNLLLLDGHDLQSRHVQKVRSIGHHRLPLGRCKGSPHGSQIIEPVLGNGVISRWWAVWIGEHVVDDQPTQPGELSDQRQLLVRV